MEEMHGNASPIAVDGADDKNKMPRHPRWTRQETFILIQSKKVIENGFGRARRSSVALASDQHEPKWDSVSSYCRQHGVNKSAVQCRKRWSNMVGDYRKIKTWESGLREQTGSFWSMRSDLRRERKMPGFFDRELREKMTCFLILNSLGKRRSTMEVPMDYWGGRVLRRMFQEQQLSRNKQVQIAVEDLRLMKDRNVGGYR